MVLVNLAIGEVIIEKSCTYQRVFSGDKLQDKRHEVGEDPEKVDNVHRSLHKPEEASSLLSIQLSSNMIVMLFLNIQNDCCKEKTKNNDNMNEKMKRENGRMFWRDERNDKD